MSELTNHPGYLGMWPVILIHADWPTYPRGMGIASALKNLGSYPSGTKFYPIDDIDKCLLFLNLDPVTIKGDIYDDKKYHMVLWQKDINELQKQGFITGSVAINEFEWELNRFNDFKKKISPPEDKDGNLLLFTKDSDGSMKQHVYKKPVLEDFDIDPDEDPSWCTEWAQIDKWIEVTAKGQEEIKRIAQEETFSEEIEKIARPLIDLQLYDTAIRESVLLIESKIKGALKSARYGQDLIEEHVKYIVGKNGSIKSAAIKSYRAELRCLFKYIRNEFMHNMKEMSKVETMLVMSKVNDVYTEMLEVFEAYK